MEYFFITGGIMRKDHNDELVWDDTVSAVLEMSAFQCVLKSERELFSSRILLVYLNRLRSFVFLSGNEQHAVKAAYMYVGKRLPLFSRDVITHAISDVPVIHGSL